MRILLASVPWSKMVNSYPPLGMGYLAAVLREWGKIEASIQIMDFGLYPAMKPRETARYIMAEGPPDILGLSCLTHNFKSSLELASIIKEAHPGLKTVYGGPHPSVDPKAVAAFQDVDAVVYGEGEETFLDLVKKAMEGKWVEDVPGTAYRKNGEVIVNPPRPLIEDLDTLPFPARDLLELDRYCLRSEEGHPIYTLLSSRGCPYACTYCFKGIFGNRYRVRSAENVLSEIVHLVKTYGAQHLYFGDDIFMLNASRVQEICEGILNKGLRLFWSCLARVDRVTPDLLKIMKSAGCVQIHYGIESGSQEILRRIKKKIKLEEVEQAVEQTRKAGIRAKGYFMAGLPGDTEETLSQTLRFARSLPLDDVMFSLATPFPGSVLWDEMSKVAHPEDIEDYDRAFYFDDGAGEVKAFFNLSHVETRKLEDFVKRTQAYFQRRREKKSFNRRYGVLVGPLAHLAYRYLRKHERKETVKT